MICPKCKALETKVVDSRVAEQGKAIRRRRECEKCGRRFTTVERAEMTSLIVKKKDNSNEPYSRVKLESGIWSACGKLPITQYQIDEMINEL